MNINEYNSDPRYWAVWEKMQLLQIEDISTPRQEKNGTVVWKLPIKNWNSGKTNIEVASFSTGYVRNQNSGYSNYQLNKRCEGEPEYFKLSNGDYRRFSTRSCVLIPVEIDRLEYLLKYCVKNYYIKHANQVPDGDFVPKWRFDNAIDERDSQSWRDKVKFLQSDVDEHANTVIKLEEKLFDLQNKLATIKRIADYETI